MGSPKSIQEMLKPYIHQAQVERVIRVTEKLFSLLMLLPEFNNLSSLRYTENAGVSIKWKDNSENIVNYPIEDAQKFAEELYKTIKTINLEKEKK